MKLNSRLGLQNKKATTVFFDGNNNAIGKRSAAYFHC